MPETAQSVCQQTKDRRERQIARLSELDEIGLLEGLDDGIREYVRCLRSNGVDTFESCEGGAGHAFAEPTIRLYGTTEAGWRALATCLAHALPVLALRRVWYVLDTNEPTGPDWELVFRAKATLNQA
jgi:hypothetical protein